MTPHDKAAEQLHNLLAHARQQHASDLMLSVNQPAMLRRDGAWHPHDKPLTNSNVNELAQVLIHTSNTDATPEDVHDFDGAFKAADGSRVRVNIFRTEGELGIVLRLIPEELPTIRELGLPDALEKLVLNRNRGLILVTGATGQGKSTSIAALVNTLNEHKQLHIITLEDPIEYRHQNKRSIVHQRQIGIDTPTFHTGLRSALRQSPDVLVIGELRDHEAMSAALTAAETGHLVLGTLHTSGTEDTINRIIDSFPAEQHNQIRQQLSHNLTAITSQALIPQIGGGRVLAHELMINTPAISNLIRDQRTNQIPTAIQSGKAHGMNLFEQTLANLLITNRITHSNAYTYTRAKETLDALLEARTPA